MKITIFAITPDEFGIPMFTVHGLDLANATLAKLRRLTPGWEFFACSPMRKKEVLGRANLSDLQPIGYR